MKGFTLIESIIVIAIFAIVALASVNTITEFQRNAILSSATQELGSTLRSAQQDSISGLVSPGGAPATYGVSISGNSYQLNRYVGGSLITPPLEQHAVDSSLSVTLVPSGISTVIFNRVTGTPSAALTITLKRTNATASRSAVINANGLISL